MIYSCKNNNSRHRQCNFTVPSPSSVIKLIVYWQICIPFAARSKCWILNSVVTTVHVQPPNIKGHFGASHVKRWGGCPLLRGSKCISPMDGKGVSLTRGCPFLRGSFIGGSTPSPSPSPSSRHKAYILSMHGQNLFFF